MYATTGDDATGAIYFSPDAGLTWYNVGTGLPNVSMRTVVIDPTDANVIFVGTDVGLFRGTHSGGTPGTWTWCAYNNGLPKTALIRGLAVHKESGMLRAFTYGRSAWEVNAFGVPRLEQKVNTANPVTDVQPPRIGGNFYAGGTRVGVAWRDDRNGANQWHAYLKAYTNAGGVLTAMNTSDVAIDLNAPRVESLSFSGHPRMASAPYCGRAAWHDRRVNGVNAHIFTEYACSDGWTMWYDDMRVDTHADSVDATNPAIVTQNGVNNLEFAVAWESGSPRKIYAGFFTWAGPPKSVPTYGTNSFPVSASSLDASAPAVAANSLGEVVIAWQEHAGSGADYIYARKYTRDGVPITIPVRVDNGAVASRGQVSITFDSNNKAVIAWSEAAAGQPFRIVSVGCPASATLSCFTIDASCKRCFGGGNGGAGCFSDDDCPSGSCASLRTVSCGRGARSSAGRPPSFQRSAATAAGTPWSCGKGTRAMGVGTR
jgi:hypothetical protein